MKDLSNLTIYLTELGYQNLYPIFKKDIDFGIIQIEIEIDRVRFILHSKIDPFHIEHLILLKELNFVFDFKFVVNDIIHKLFDNYLEYKLKKK
jgi:hypothetical protein